MEEGVRESSPSSETPTMDESLEHIFSIMIRQGQILDAVDFIRSIDMKFLPSKTILSTIIIEILMKSEDIKCLALSYDYLVNVLSVFPPTNDELRQYYYDSIRDSHGFLADLWKLFCHVVNSYFCHHAIYVIDAEENASHVIKYPNCKFLLDFYVKIFSVDFEYKSSSSPCLAMRLFWPNYDTRSICLSNRTELLFKWINDIYGCVFVNNVGNLLRSMHEMLTLMVRCFMEVKNNFTDFTAFSSPVLAEIVEAIVNFCKNSFSNLPNVKIFLNLFSIKYLQAKLSEKILKQITKQSSKRYCVRTLKDIVDQCMFPSKFNKWKNTKPVNIEKNLRKRPEKRMPLPDMKMETTKLHEMCKKNKFGDLFEALKSSCENVNARDPNGSTPLHEACASSNRLCVKHLIDLAFTGGVQTLDLAAVNLEGQTPLHLAVMNNVEDIARKLLFYGGAELLTIADNRGQLPGDLSSSEAMNKLIEEYQVNLKELTESESSNNYADRETPILRSFREYSIYLHALNCLLCTYCNLFKLVDFIWKKNGVVGSHNDKACYHFIDKNICSEDEALISEMPDIIDIFIESVNKNVAKHNINVDIELIPLRAFAASLKVS